MRGRKGFRSILTVAFCQDILPVRRNSLRGDGLVSDTSLDRDSKHLPGDELLELMHQCLPDLIRRVSMANDRKWVCWLIVDSNLKLDELVLPISRNLVLHRCIAFAFGLELVKVVSYDLSERDVKDQSGTRISLRERRDKR